MKKNLITLSFLFLSIISFAQVTNSCILPNAGFELGNTSGWTFKSGGYGVFTPCPSGTCPRYGTNYTGGAVAGALNAPLNGATNRHTLMSTAGGNDPNATTPAVPVVAPGGGTYSFRLGNTVTGTGGTNQAQAEAARLTFAVTNQNAFFTYRYAFFVADGAHAFMEQPSFEVVVLDQNDVVIPCGRFFVVAGNYASCVNTAGFVTGNNGYVYKPWTDVGLDLTGYIGTNISIEFRTTDCQLSSNGSSTSCSNGICTLTNAVGTCTYLATQPPCTPTSGVANCSSSPGTHSAYAYIDAYCSPLDVKTPVFCAGAANVQICAPAGYQSYSWPAGQPGLTGSPTTQCVNITNPVAGTTYTVNMTSVTGCITSTTIKLSGFDLTLRDTTVCNGAPAFPLTLTPSTPGTYNYTWTPATGLSCTNCQSPTYTPGSSSASYTVTMKDPSPGGCTKTKVVNIIINQNLSVTATGTTVCSGTSAVLTASAISCGSGLTYSWSPSTFLSSTTGTSVTAVNPTSTITYTVTVKDGSGQTSSNTAVLTVNPIPVISVPSATICNGASTPLTASGANTYTWSPATGLSSTSGANVTANPTVTTTYTITGTSAAGCVSSTTVAVTVNPIPVVTVNSATVCPNEPAVLTAAGATTYLWSNNATTNPITVNVGATTSYTVIGTSLSCTSSAVATVVVSNVLVPTVNTPTICAGESATLTLSGGTTFTWSTGSNANPIVVSPATTTAYTATVSSASGCTGTVTATVIVNPLPVLAITNPPGVCIPGTIDITGTAVTAGSTGGGVLSYWMDAAATQTLTNPTAIATAGTYYIKSTTAGGCIDIKPVVVSFNPIPVITVNSETICPTTSAVLTASSSIAGTTYSWSTNATTNPITVSPGATTTYTVTGTALGCSSTALSTVVVNSVLVGTVNTPTVCAGVTATLTVVSSANSYTWNTGSNTNPLTVTPAVNTVYSCTIMNAAGCVGTVSTTVYVDPIPVLAITNPPAVCIPGTISITGATVTAGSTGGGVLSYWMDAAATQTLTNPTAISTAGTYYIKTTTAGGCTDIKPVVVTFNTPPPSNAGPNLILCSGTTGVIGSTAVTGYTYVWSLPIGLTSSTVSDPTVNLTNTGALPIVTVYTVTTTETATGCQSSDTVMVTITSITTANAGTSQLACVGSTFALSGSVGGSATSGTWSGGAGLFSPSASALNAVYFPTATEYAAGSVTLTLTSNDPVGPCTFASSSVVLNFQPAPVVNFSVDIPKGCPIHCVKFTDQTTIKAPDFIKSWSWSFGDGGTSNLQNPPHCYKNTGIYSVTLTATSNLGCSSTLVIPAMIEVYSMPIASFIPTPSVTVITDPLISFQNTSINASTYNWNFGDPHSTAVLNNSILVNPNHTYSVTGQYLVTLIATSINGCVDTAKVMVEIQPEFIFYIPNAFTPGNGDGVNDFFTGFGIGIDVFEMWIFDRWGVNIFYTNDMSKGWDGKLKGHSEEVQQDVYIWKVKLKDVFGKSHSYVGHVTLLK